MRHLTILQQGLDLLFPPTCTVCKRTGYVLCPTCQSSIARFMPPLCQRCGRTQIVQGICQQCRRHLLRLSGLRAIGPYSEPLRTCIHTLKYAGVTRLAEPLGIMLAQAASYYGMNADLLIPVPLHIARQQERGYNHADLLAQVCARQLGIPAYNDILIRTRATAAQVHLSGEARQQNMMDAFVCNPAYATGALHKRRIIIIDDVCTTGATLEACAEPLFVAGAAVVLGLVLARPQ